jgi:hypothetical protein
MNTIKVKAKDLNIGDIVLYSYPKEPHMVIKKFVIDRTLQSMKLTPGTKIHLEFNQLSSKYENVVTIRSCMEDAEFDAVIPSWYSQRTATLENEVKENRQHIEELKTQIEIMNKSIDDFAFIFTKMAPK